MVRGSFAWLGVLLCGSAATAACSGRATRGGSPAGETGGVGARPVDGPGGSTAISPSTGGKLTQGGAGPGEQPGQGGATETAGGGGEGGAALEPPSFWWDCPLEAWGDGRCDCGCGIRDIDCPDGDVASCEVCDGTGSCNRAPCPGRIKPADNSHCEPVPPGWHCEWPSYADESSCDCGCGVPDPDCDSATPVSCDTCKLPGSCAATRTDDCTTAIHPTDHFRCYVPEEWICFMGYGDGVCDCGCGAVDVDCPSTSVQDCENCDEGCANGACPGKISLVSNAVCTPPPAGWRCPEYRYQDNIFCDCGCGVPDPDCPSSSSESCDWCNEEGSCSIQTCPGTIAPTDNATCYQPEPPEWWTCSPTDYADGTTCDCGCGAYDLDCLHEGPAACDDCHTCGPCPDSINPLTNSHCN